MTWAVEGTVLTLVPTVGSQAGGSGHSPSSTHQWVYIGEPSMRRQPGQTPSGLKPETPKTLSALLRGGDSRNCHSWSESQEPGVLAWVSVACHLAGDPTGTSESEQTSRFQPALISLDPYRFLKTSFTTTRDKQTVVGSRGLCLVRIPSIMVFPC